MAPANTVTEVGTPLGAVLFRLTANPPVGAAVAIVTVPEVAVPPVTDVGLIAREETVGALMVSLADFESVSVDAKIVTVVVVAIGFAANVKLVVVLLPGITTVAGTLVRWLESTMLTETACPDALPANQRVPVTFPPPATEVGDNVNEAMLWP